MKGTWGELSDKAIECRHKMFEIIVQNSCSMDTLTRAHTALY